MDQKRSRCKKCGAQSVVYDEHLFAFVCTDCGQVDRKRTKELQRQEDRRKFLNEFPKGN